jgi:hypothetical protein
MLGGLAVGVIGSQILAGFLQYGRLDEPLVR